MDLRMPFKINAGKEIHSIGLLRGIASLMVCYYHLAHENPRLPDNSIVKQMGAWGWSGVEIFFIISGFVIPYSMYVNQYHISKIGVFLKKRIIRIEPPYLISILLVLILSYVSSIMPSYGGLPFNIDWANVASHIAYLNVFTGEKWLQDVYWTLAVEFQYYLLIAFAYTLIASAVVYYRLLFYCLFLGGISVGFLGSSFIFQYTGYFMLGILLFQYYCNVISDKEFWVLLIINFAVLFFHEGIVLTSLSAATLLLIVYVKKVPSFLQFLGMISFSLYLIHIPIGGRINNLTAIVVKNNHAREVMVFVAIAICLIAAFVFYLLVEKTFKKLAASILYHTNTVSV